MNNLTDRQIRLTVELMPFFDLAEKRWPDLTPEQCGDVVRSVGEQFPDESAVLQVWIDRIEAEIVKRLGPGRSLITPPPPQST